MTIPEAVTVTVTQKHIENGTIGRDPIELAVLNAIPGAVNAQAWFLDAELREMSARVWLAGTTSSLPASSSPSPSHLRRSTSSMTSLTGSPSFRSRSLRR